MMWCAHDRLDPRLDSFEVLILPASQALRLLRPPGDEYLAGLWRSSLLSDLCWFVKDVEMVTQAHPGRAPSWSWASLDGAVYMPLMKATEDYHCVAVDASVTLASPDSTGPATGGYIILSGQVPTIATFSWKCLDSVSEGEDLDGWGWTQQN
ncbi:hypothetical protein B0T17DRAFT_507904 [Bombardia bombarda]|uniref:Uncharacterized protein n=1 Tax=Bombardia bombarda TaxID=252184 RepID=A0AA39X089_9PEZI|nr:hypothetical protein B0T17DRAFT_507904 [Bombardia bombarda]